LKLNRVKTHRVLVGLIERGVVRAEKHFNTNMITLSDWLMGGEHAEPKDDA
jgi:DNA-binding IclR family transcriptional regulator